MKKNEIAKLLFQDLVADENYLIEWLSDICFARSLEVIEETLLSVKEIAKECDTELTDKFIIYEDYGAYGIADKKYYGVVYKENWKRNPIGTIVKEL